MKYSTYILLCQNGTYYTGHTSDLSERFIRHLNKTGAKHTAQNAPLKIVWSQNFNTEIEAIKREQQIKGWSRAKKEKLIKGIWG